MVQRKAEKREARGCRCTETLRRHMMVAKSRETKANTDCEHSGVRCCVWESGRVRVGEERATEAVGRQDSRELRRNGKQSFPVKGLHRGFIFVIRHPTTCPFSSCFWLGRVVPPPAPQSCGVSISASTSLFDTLYFFQKRHDLLHSCGHSLKTDSPSPHQITNKKKKVHVFVIINLF